MKLFKVKRESKLENRYSEKMGRLITRVTTIKIYFLEILPIKTLHKYRETYYGKVKDIEDCELNK